MFRASLFYVPTREFQPLNFDLNDVTVTKRYEQYCLCFGIFSVYNLFSLRLTVILETINYRCFKKIKNSF